MTNLEERISALEAKIEGYGQEYANASPEEKKELRPLITESKKTLNLLLQQQQPQGEKLSPSCLSVQHRCFEINHITWLTPHLTIIFASFCNIAQAGGGQGEYCVVLCDVFVIVIVIVTHIDFNCLQWPTRGSGRFGTCLASVLRTTTPSLHTVILCLAKL